MFRLGAFRLVKWRDARVWRTSGDRSESSLQVMVADTGNHRVSFYNENGLMKSGYLQKPILQMCGYHRGDHFMYLEQYPNGWEWFSVTSDLVVVPKKVKKEITLKVIFKWRWFDSAR